MSKSQNGMLLRFRRWSRWTTHLTLVLMLQFVAGHVWAEELHRAAQTRRALGEPSVFSKVTSWLPEAEDVHGWLDSTVSWAGSAVSSSVEAGTRELVSLAHAVDSAVEESMESLVELAEVSSMELSASDVAGPSSVFGAHEPRRILPPLPEPPVGALAPGFGTPPWHLLSVPDEPDNVDPAVLLDTVAGDFTLAYSYDACDPVSPWRLYDPADLAGSDLTAVDHRIGFWLKSADPDPLAVVGTEPAETSIRLCPGWNLIGYPLAQDRPVLAALSSIMGKFLRVYGFDPEDEVEPWKVYDVGVPDWANTLQVMERGKGYWIYATEDVTLVMRNVGPPPEVEILSPADGDTVTAPTDVVASVRSDLLDRWTLEHRYVGETEWVTFASGNTPVVNEAIASFDPTLLTNGLYEVRLTALDFTGAGAQDSILLVVEGPVKLGVLSLSFTDLQVPVAGLPITVTRTYDNRDRRRSEDFGFGWSLSVSDARVQESGPAGLGWQGTREGGGLSIQYCITPTKLHLVTIALPSEEVLTYRATLEKSCTPLVPPSVVTLRFLPLGLTRVALAPLDIETDALVVGSFPTDGSPGPIELWTQSITNVFDADQYQVSTRENLDITIDQDDGIRQVEDAFGNLLSFNADGIHSSTGKSITFGRDAEGRIETITDPNGKIIRYNYDGTGDLVKVTDPLGHEDTFDYDGGHRMLSYSLADGSSIFRNEYDSDGRLVGVQDPKGSSRKFDYDLESNAVRYTDRLGHTTVVEYDPSGNIVRTADALGHETHQSFDATGLPTAVTDALDHTSNLGYDGEGRLMGFTDPLQHTTVVRYSGTRPSEVVDATGRTQISEYNTQGLRRRDAIRGADGMVVAEILRTFNDQGLLETSTDPNNCVTEFAYDTFGNVERVTDPLGSVTTQTYDANGNLLTRTQSRTRSDGQSEDLITTFEYDDSNRLVATTFPDGSREEYFLDAFGRRIGVTDVLGRETSFTYDVVGQLTSVQHPDDTSESWTYDAEGRALSYIDRGGRTFTMEYDALGRLLHMTDPEQGETFWEYDALGRETAVIDPTGRRIERTYDAAGRLVSETGPLGTSLTYTYYDDGSLASIKDARGDTTRFEYDAFRELSRTIFPDDQTETVVRDAAGQVIERTDPSDHTTSMSYDCRGRLATVVDATGGTTTYSYDELDNLVAVVDAEGRTARFAYDRLGNLTETTLPLGQKAVSAHDAAGRVLSVQDFDGRTTAFTYDAADRIERETFAGGEVVYSYYPSGMRKSVTDSNGTTSYSYDGLDRLLSVDRPGAGDLSYSHDAAGRRTSVTTTDGTSHFFYDDVGRLSTFRDPSGAETVYAYAPTSQLESITYPNGVTTRFTVDGRYQLTDISTEDANGTVLSRYEYTLGAAGQRERVVEASGRTVDYVYDAQDRLLSETIQESDGSQRVLSYTYDKVGNRLTKTDGGILTQYQYDDNDRLLSAGGASFSYSAGGDLISRLESDGSRIDYTYDHRHRMVQATRTASDGATSLFTQQFDDEGAVIGRTIDGEDRRYVVDHNRPFHQVLLELDDTDAVVARMAHGLDLVSEQRGGELSYPHHDGSMSVRTATNGDAQPTHAFDYDAFGNLLASSEPTPLVHRYTGERWLAELGLYDLRARLYDPSLGRFLTMDNAPPDFFRPSTLNRYSYVQNNPVNFVDPSGRWSLGSLMVSLANMALSFGRSAVTIVRGYATIENAKFILGAMVFLAAVASAFLNRSTTQAGFIVSIKNPNKKVYTYPDVGMEVQTRQNPGTGTVTGNPVSAIIRMVIRVDTIKGKKFRFSIGQGGLSISGGINLNLWKRTVVFVKTKLDLTLRAGASYDGPGTLSPDIRGQFELKLETGLPWGDLVFRSYAFSLRDIIEGRFFIGKFAPWA